jgi:hypothetical protein
MIVDNPRTIKEFIPILRGGICAHAHLNSDPICPNCRRALADKLELLTERLERLAQLRAEVHALESVSLTYL